MKALIIGATGAVGADLCNLLLKDKDFEEIEIFVRRPSGITNDKLTEHIVDFENIADWKHLLKGDVLFSCLGTTKKKIVAFICVHNSCRSQIAEALGKHFAGDIFESYSAGTVVVDKINQDAVRLMKKLYGIDMEANGQYSKVIDEIPAPDIAISMGCNVTCPFVGRPFDDNWNLEDPTGKSDIFFMETITEIEKRIAELKTKLMNNLS